MNPNEPALSGDYATIAAVIREHGDEFMARGFKLDSVTLVGSPELKQFPSFNFRSQKMDRVILMSFAAASEGRNGGFVILIMTSKNLKLDVQDYLKRHGREDLSRHFTYQDPKTDIRLFADSFLQVFFALLDNELKPIIDGKTFEETPIDWMGWR